jgi:hypothetical protein
VRDELFILPLTYIVESRQPTRAINVARLPKAVPAASKRDIGKPPSESTRSKAVGEDEWEEF